MFKQNNLLTVIILTALALVLFSGCMEDDSTPTPSENAPEVVGSPTPSATPTQTITVTLSSTPTYSPEPLSTPESTPTPAPLPTPTIESTPTPMPTVIPVLSTYEVLAQLIADTNPILPASLADIYGILHKIDTAKREDMLTSEEVYELEESLKTKFNQWIMIRVDNIYVTSPNSLGDFLNNHAVQDTREYGRLINEETRIYEKDALNNKYNQWIRNQLKEIDPDNSNSLSQFYDIELFQSTDIYDDLAMSVTRRYIDGQMPDMFNEWVRNTVDGIDTNSSSDSLVEFIGIELIQVTEIYDKLVTPQTHVYTDGQITIKFNKWITNKIDDLNPDISGFIEDIAEILTIKATSEYQAHATPLTNDYLEQQLPVKVGEHMTDLVNGIGSKTSTTFPNKLYSLVSVMQKDIYDELCPDIIKEYVKDRLRITIAAAVGLAPSVVATLPNDGEIDVPVTSAIMITFDQAMAPQAVESAITISPNIEFDATWIAANWIIPGWEQADGHLIALLKSANALEPSTAYTIDIGLRAVSVQSVAPDSTHTFSFTTKSSGTPPQISNIVPVDEQTDAPIGGTIRVVFDQEMIAESVESAISISPRIDYDIRWQSGNTVAVLQPLESLDFDTNYKVTIGAEAISINSIPLGEDYTFIFFTGIHGGPHILSTMPTDGQVGIPSGYPIQVFFNRSMDPDSVEDALSVTPDIEYKTKWYEADFVLEIEPQEQLVPNTTYTFEIGGQSTSSHSRPLGQSYRFSFTTLDE
ncbi:MAG: Ig-like domain-containing protein [Chloroflexi bacterium]|nr:Ig-like domain-containing protein [Chloroflexota bacterium]